MMPRLRINRVSLFGGILFFAAQAAVVAQEPSLAELLPGLKERAVVLNIIARVVEKDQHEVWNSYNSKVTIPGRPVGLKLVGANIVVAVQFTPYLRQNGTNILVAQGQIWVDIPDQGIRYQTTFQAIPLAFGEQVYFFPLGSLNSQDEAYIEIQLELHPYSGYTPHEEPPNLSDSKDASPSSPDNPEPGPDRNQ
ncbi:MAG: hypothetical protein LBT14_14375 [Treponema sp.]|jgi:hypothetical protein|nr:hypothetical protein [Treponema sp.]